MNDKIFVLVDCNSFYCSCERLFRPDLRFRPVGVLSNNDGCFVSRTNELKKLGVAMGAPYFQVKNICDKNNVAVFSANFSLYTNLSDRVMNTLFEFTPNLEVYSVDEDFLDLTGFEEKTIED
jgi:DNA polymerase V